MVATGDTGHCSQVYPNWPGRAHRNVHIARKEHTRHRPVSEASGRLETMRLHGVSVTRNEEHVRERKSGEGKEGSQLLISVAGGRGADEKASD